MDNGDTVSAVEVESQLPFPSDDSYGPDGQRERGRPENNSQHPLDFSSSSDIWDTSRRYRRDGYYSRHVFDHAEGRCRSIFEHVLIWERAHGKPVPDTCYIHHRDLNRGNNSLENLMCIPKALHQELHARLDKVRETTTALGFEVERYRITQEYERKAAELLELWDLIRDAQPE